MIGSEQLSLTVQVAAVLGPVAAYFLLLGLLNSQPRPQLLSGRTDFILLNAAFFPLLSLPLLSLLGVSAWTVLGVVGAILAVAVVLAPRGVGNWVVYNISLPEALRAAERALMAMGQPFRRQGRKLLLAGSDVTLRLESLGLLRNVTVSAEGQCPDALARQFRTRLDTELGRIRTIPGPMAVTFLLLATAMLVAPLGLFADRAGEMVRIITDLVR